MKNCLLEKLRNIKLPIVANNDKDYNFLIKMKEYYNLRIDIYRYNLFLFLGNSHTFNNDEEINYDKKINKCIFLIDNLDEINLKSSEFFYI